jgi:hypothetical protein
MMYEGVEANDPLTCKKTNTEHSSHS